MNRKLSDELVVELTFLTTTELHVVLKVCGDYCSAKTRFDLIEYIAKYHGDEEIKPLLPTPPKLQENNKTVDERIKELRNCYQKSDTNNEGVTVENVVRSRGRKKSQNGTLKDRVFVVLDNGITTYEEVLKAGIINIAENTFKTILSQWRKEKGIKVSRGRRKGGK